MVFRFNPRARGGRDGKSRAVRAAFPVSIHAPAGGATSGICSSLRTNGVSIHAPAGGATTIVAGTINEVAGFNPRARGGRDRIFAANRARPEKFQSTRPRGARLSILSPECWTIQVSIHAPAGGATKAQLLLAPLSSSFNPRARGGRDMIE